jgi:drug/metabolite transporter (DMT)-like permease
MSRRDLFDLLLLAALWGASFLFLRYAVPAFGPVALIEVRVALAAAVLLPWLWWRGGGAALLTHWRPLLTVGLLNSALPFVLLSYATLTLTAGVASILNATTPLWTAAVAVVWLGQRFGRRQWLGLALGWLGVAILVWGKVDLRPGSSGFAVALSVGACLLATFAYGVAANFTRRRLSSVEPRAVAAGSQASAAVLLLPPALLWWPSPPPPATAWLAALALGLACTALAYLLYFRLLARIGALRAASVTFLIPVFATLWGALFLAEALTLQMLAGAAVVFAGTALALNLLPGQPRKPG